jgi:predicted component of type VI protein secretion system
MNVRLVIVRKRKRVWAARLCHAEATLGRARGCTIRIPSAQVSRLHCRLRIENGLVTVEDLESVNGTFLNGKRVRDTEIVHPGDRLTIGPVTFVVEYELPSEALRPLSDEEAYQALETESDVELVKDTSSQVETKPPSPGTEAQVEVVKDAGSQKKTKPPAAKPLAVREETDVELVPLAEQDEIHLADNGTLRDFLIGLDNADNPSGERS